MPIKKSDPRIFTTDFKPESLSDVANIVATEWVSKLRLSLEVQRPTDKPSKPMSDKRANGALQSSMVPIIKTSPSFVQIEIEGNAYAKFIDKGVSGTKKKYNTPYSFKGKNINQDAMKDFIVSRNIKTIPKKGQTADEAYKSLAFMIGASIASKGIRPTNFINEAVGEDEINELKKKIRQGIIDGLT